MTVTNRTAARAAAFAEEFGCAARPWAERADQRFDLLVNCTRVGMAPDVDDSPFPAEALRTGGVVFDTVYAPERTRLLREASERGARTISGVDMFLAQAAGQFERWHGRRPGAGVMRAAFDQADEDEAID
jgi:3-dehydroquinate dehydratase/shikimate dehydrogenase